MTSSLSNIVTLMDGICKIKCKDCNCFLESESAKDNLIKYKCPSGKKGYSEMMDENLQNQFKNTSKFSNNINEFILLLRKGIYPYEFMDDWEKFKETSFPEKNKSIL